MSFRTALPTASRGGRRATTMLESAMRKLQELGINLLALDFDQTIIDIHTYGQYKGTAEELTEHVRPELRQLMQACCHHNIHLCVVTFSGQVKLVRGVVEAIVGVDRAGRIPIRGADRSWSYEGGGSRERKQHYIASAVEELEQQDPREALIPPPVHNINGTNNGSEAAAGGAGPVEPSPPPSPIRITRNSTLLIDDDPRNIRCALADGVRAIWFNPEMPHRLLQDIINLI